MFKTTEIEATFSVVFLSVLYFHIWILEFSALSTRTSILFIILTEFRTISRTLSKSFIHLMNKLFNSMNFFSNTKISLRAVCNYRFYQSSNYRTPKKANKKIDLNIFLIFIDTLHFLSNCSDLLVSL